MKRHRLVIATGNRGKIHEISAILDNPGILVVTDAGLDMASVEETGLTFVENALLKARYATQRTGLPALADDSGLEVDALDGAPGIRSSRYAGDDADTAANNARLLSALAGVATQDRTARFLCVIVVLRHTTDPAPLICEGRWEGRIATASSGRGGFGYDPLFVPEGQTTSAAQLSAAKKNRLSHRARALVQLHDRLHDFLAGSG